MRRGSTMERTGLEPATPSLQSCGPIKLNSDHDDTCESEEIARNSRRNSFGPELQQVIKAWPTLPDNIKRAVLAMIQT